MNMTRRCVIAAIGLSTVLCTTTLFAATVKIGVVLTYSGGAAEFGQQIDRGMNLYLQQHPDALGGHQVELIKRDSKRPSGDIAKTAVQELITRERVDILAGFVFSPNAMASAPLVTQGKTPMIIMNAGHRLDSQSFALYCQGIVYHVAGGLSHGPIRQRSIELPDSRRRLY